MQRRSFIQALGAAFAAPSVGLAFTPSKPTIRWDLWTDPITARYDLSSPWVLNNSTFATDGRALICAPGCEGQAAGERRVPGLHTLPWDDFDKAGWRSSSDLVRVPARAEMTCPHCFGYGVVGQRTLCDCDDIIWNGIDIEPEGTCPKCKDTGWIGTSCPHCVDEMDHWYQDSTATLFHGNSLDVLRTLPDCSVQCCVTSPPYWALRDYGVDGQLGLEDTPEQFVANMVAIFREVRRVLRDDGTLWLNIGDSYSQTGKWGGSSSNKNEAKQGYPRDKRDSGLKPKDMVGVPWLLAFAMRADGWYLRQDIIWHKKSPMPESVRDRCTKAHEYIFLFSKSQRYFYDLVGSQEQTTGNAHSRGHGINIKAKTGGQVPRLGVKQNESFSAAVAQITSKRNMRSVWPLASFPLKSAHFAAYPPELVRRCLSAGVSPHGCCANCGTPWKRIVEKRRVPTRSGAASKVNRASQHGDSPYEDHSGMVVGNRDPQRHCTETVTTGWQPGCKCESTERQPCVVLDPFHGAGTTWKVCQRLGLRYIGIDLNADYLQLSIDRPAVHFPHERKPKAKRVRRIETPMLKGLDQ